MKLLLAIAALLLGQLGGCAKAFWCELRDDSRFAIEELDAPIPGNAWVTGIAVLPEGELAVATRSVASMPAHAHELYHWSERMGLQSVMNLPPSLYRGSSLSAGSGGGWWYALAADDERLGTLTFISSNGADAPRKAVVEMPGSPAVWLPFDGPSPRGLYVVTNLGTGRTQLHDVTPAGIQATWTLNVTINRYPVRWSAELLPDGKIVLVAVEGVRPAMHEDQIDVHLLARGAEPETTTLGRMEGIGDIDTTVAADGTVAIVLATRDGVRASFVDPSNVADPKWHALTTKEELARSILATATGSDLTVSWITGSLGTMRLRARTLTPAGPALLPLTVASIVTRDEGSRFFAVVEENEDELRFYWASDMLDTRRVPRNLSGFALYQSLRERVTSSSVGRTECSD